MVLLIPRRIKQIKDEGRAEGREEGVQEGIKKGRAQEREAIDRIIARYDRGEISMDRLRAILSDRCGGYSERG